ncbi:MAG: amino acid permease [Saprospiraceae bacterium]|nr:amino acid permease [Saprospiraceae bacterium]
MSQLPRRLTFLTIVAVVIGDIIGSGIFVKPATIAQQFPSVEGILALWLFAGLMTLMGALTNAEAASLFPETGGQYILFKHMYGKLFAFLYGWSGFIVINTAGIASIAYVAAYYLDYLWPLYRFDQITESSYSISIPGLGKFFILEHFGRKLMTILIMLLFTCVNVFSVNESARLQRWLTWSKLFILFGLMACLFIFGSDAAPQDPLLQASNLSIIGCVAALAGIFWCFDGWNNVSFIAGEIVNPEKVIAKSLLIGISICCGVYLLFNLAIFYVLPLPAIQSSNFVAALAAEVVFPKWGGLILSSIVLLSVLSAVNGNILSCSRVSFSFFQDYPVSSKLTNVRLDSMSPSGALWANTIWASVLVLIGSFDMLTDLLIFVSWFFYGMSAAGVIWLRVKMPEASRPYRVPWYPWLPLGFIAFTFFYLIMTIYADVSAYTQGQQAQIKCLLGFILVIAGLPVYFWKKRGRDNS